MRASMTTGCDYKWLLADGERVRLGEVTVTCEWEGPESGHAEVVTVTVWSLKNGEDWARFYECASLDGEGVWRLDDGTRLPQELGRWIRVALESLIQAYGVMDDRGVLLDEPSEVA